MEGHGQLEKTEERDLERVLSFLVAFKGRNVFMVMEYAIARESLWSERTGLPEARVQGTVEGSPRHRRTL